MCVYINIYIVIHRLFRCMTTLTYTFKWLLIWGSFYFNLPSQYVYVYMCVYVNIHIYEYVYIRMYICT